MEEGKQDISILGVAPPKARVSIVLNGFGNGLMLAGGPFVLARIASEFFPKMPMHKHFNKLAIVASTIGGGIGVAYGLTEAKHLDDYRAALAQKLNALDEKIGASR